MRKTLDTCLSTLARPWKTLTHPSISLPCSGYNKITISDFTFKTSAETKHFSYRKQKRPSVTAPKRFFFFYSVSPKELIGTHTHVLVLLQFLPNGQTRVAPENNYGNSRKTKKLHSNSNQGMTASSGSKAAKAHPAEHTFLLEKRIYLHHQSIYQSCYLCQSNADKNVKKPKSYCK